MYQVATFDSPNRRFFSSIAALSAEQLARSAQRVVVFGALECVALLLLGAFVCWQLRLNVLQLLAFVLETHMTSVQGKIVFFLTFVLDFDLQHFGTRGAPRCRAPADETPDSLVLRFAGCDFSFRFAWLHS